VKIKAAVVTATSGRFELQDLDLSDPRADEVLVRIVATGICATDLHIRDGGYPVPLPVVAGHEGAGVVESVGSAVTTLTPGDKVVLSYPYCGHCRFCLRAEYPYCADGFALSFGGGRSDGSSALSRAGERVNGHIFGQSSFATHAVVTERNAVKVTDDAPLELLGPLGCGFQTGAGAVLNGLRVRSNESVAVFGTGSVGLAAVMAASFVGASPIVAVDINPQRLELAGALGATHSVNTGTEDLQARLAEISGGGFDHVLEVTARPEMLSKAVEVIAMTGSVALVGGAPSGTTATIDMNTLLNGRRVRGIVQGDAVSKLFIPQLIDQYRAGRFPFDELTTFYDFEQINDAIADMTAGRVIKPILRISSA
jgi:aryl-alcohol dehydrogenase